MSQWVNVGAFLLTMVGSIVVNMLAVSYQVGKKTGTHLEKIQALEKWKAEHIVKYDRVSQEVAYLSGRLNGGTYKHQ